MDQKKNATLGIGWGYYSKKICNNPNFDTLSSFLELDFNIFNQKLFKIAICYLKNGHFQGILILFAVPVQKVKQ